MKIFLLLFIFFASANSNAAIFKDPFGTKKYVKKIEKKAITVKYSCDVKSIGGNLTLADSINLALCNNPEVRASWSHILENQERLGTGYSKYLPKVNASVGYIESSSNINLVNPTTLVPTTIANHGAMQVSNVSMNYLLYDFGKRSAEVKSLKNSLIASGFSHNEKLQDIVLKTNRLYYAHLAAVKMFDSKVKLESLATKSMEFADKRKSAGKGTKLDILQAKSSYQNAKSKRIRAEKEVDMSRVNLFLHIGLDIKTEAQLDSPNILQIEKIDKAMQNDIKKLLETAKNVNPKVREAYFMLKKAKSELVKEKAGYYPSISANAGVYDFNGVGGNTTNLRASYVGASLAIPIFSGFETDYAVRLKEREEDFAKAKLDMVHLEVQKSVWQAYFDFENSKEDYKASLEFLDAALEAENFASKGYKAGVINILDLLSAQSNLALADEGYIVSFFNKEIAKVSLMKAIGSLNV